MTPFSILYRGEKTFLVDESPSTEYAMYIDKERPCKVGWAFLPSEVIWRGSLWRERRMKRFVHGGWGDWGGSFWAGEEIVGSLAKWGYWYLGCHIYDKSLKCPSIARSPKVEVNGFWTGFLLQFCVRIQDLGLIFRSDPVNKLDQLRFENFGLWNLLTQSQPRNTWFSLFFYISPWLISLQNSNIFRWVAWKTRKL